MNPDINDFDFCVKQDQQVNSRFKMPAKNTCSWLMSPSHHHFCEKSRVEVERWGKQVGFESIHSQHIHCPIGLAHQVTHFPTLPYQDTILFTSNMKICEM